MAPLCHISEVTALRSTLAELTRLAPSATKLGQPRCPIYVFTRSIFVVSLLNLREVPGTHSK
jgi:hypothetical protein